MRTTRNRISIRVALLAGATAMAASLRAKETGQPTEPVTRRWAWVELALLVGLVVALVIAVVG